MVLARTGDSGRSLSFEHVGCCQRKEALEKRARESIILFSLDQPMTLGKPWCPRPASRPARLVCHCWRAGEASIETGSPTSPTYTCSFWPHRHIHASPPWLSWRWAGWRILGGNRAPSTSHALPPEASHPTPGAHLLVGWVDKCVCVRAHLLMYMTSWLCFFPRGVGHASTCAFPLYRGHPGT